MRGHRVAQDGSAQVAQAEHGPGSPPEPHVAVSVSDGRKKEEVFIVLVVQY